MWMVKPRPNPAWEPLELIILKQKLAKLSSSICKCLTDRSAYCAPIKPTVPCNPNEKGVQVSDHKSGSYDRFTQASQSSIRKDREELANSLTKDVLCPSCFVTMNLLRGGMLKILKDEQSETMNDMFSCDKATENNVRSLEKTTSYTSKPRVMFSDASLYELCDSSLYSSLEKRSIQQVKFGQVTMNSHQQTSFTNAPPPCFCLEKFVDSIRPPIMNSVAY